MTPYYEEKGIRIFHGDCREVLAGLPEESVHCIVTSPPYWGLRSYKTEPLIWSGVEGCEHIWSAEAPHGRRGKRGISGTGGNLHPTLDAAGVGAGAGTSGSICSLCGAWRGSLGLEPIHSCGRSESGLLELRKDLTEEEFQYVLLELRKGGLL
jgi:site-specific DNA-methyltransferase (cytosine-N4-specific)